VAALEQPVLVSSKMLRLSAVLINLGLVP
jgi:hypothetical protein